EITSRTLTQMGVPSTNGLSLDDWYKYRVVAAEVEAKMKASGWQPPKIVLGECLSHAETAMIEIERAIQIDRLSRRPPLRLSNLSHPLEAWKARNPPPDPLYALSLASLERQYLEFKARNPAAIGELSGPHLRSISDRKMIDDFVASFEASRIGDGKLRFQ